MKATLQMWLRSTRAVLSACRQQQMRAQRELTRITRKLAPVLVYKGG